MPKPWVVGLGAFASGVVVTSGAWTAFPSRAAPPVSKEETKTPNGESDTHARAGDR